MGPGNQLLSDGTYEYTYDREGNLVAKIEPATGDRWEYAYDHRNRLTAVRLWGGGTTLDLEVRFEYDALDRRISRSEDADGAGPAAAVVESYVLDGEHVWADLDAAGQVTARYLYGEQVDALLARWRDTDGLAWYLPDHLGSVRDIADASGALVDTIDYGAFGNVVSESNPAAGDRFKYTGREWDAAIDLYSYRAGIMILPAAASSTAIPSGSTAATATCTGMWRTIRSAARTPAGRQRWRRTRPCAVASSKPLMEGFTCVGREAAENLPELVLGGGTAYLADMGVTRDQLRRQSGDREGQ